MSWWVVSGFIPLACGKLPLAIVQVLPAVFSLQAASALLPSEPVIVAPVIAFAPPESLVSLIVAVSKAARAAFAAPAV